MRPQRQEIDDMMRWIFIIANGIWSGVHLKAGIAGTMAAGAAWDAGSLDLFTAFWIGFAAVGFWRRSFWVVSMAVLVLACVTALETLMLVAGDLPRQAVFSDSSRMAAVRIGGEWFLLIAGWLYALAAHRSRTRSDSADAE